MTYSLLSRFVACRERFRVHAIEGLQPADDFNHRIEFGQMWHECESAAAKFSATKDKLDAAHKALLEYGTRLGVRYPTRQEQVSLWYAVCKLQFGLYLDYWAAQPDEVGRQELQSERPFDVSYKLPSGRKVRLRGKRDGVDLIESGAPDDGVYLREHKTKSDIDQGRVVRQLAFDLQTGIYLVALREEMLDSFWQRSNKRWRDRPINGVRYNVVRRPLSGGRHSIVQHKPSKSNPNGETRADYLNRLAGLIASEPDYFFMRWKVHVTPADIERFRRRCLDPILEQLCDWWDWINLTGRFSHYSESALNPDPFSAAGGGIHWQHPFGVYNAVDEAGCSDVDDYLSSGSEVGLKRADSLFSELE